MIEYTSLADALINLVLLFFIFCFAGWCIEVGLKFIQYRRFINRGFLNGPWLPIYGLGSVLITVSIGAIASYESSYGTTFVISFIVCGIVEYLASFILEKLFHARWWDYSSKPMNLNGRVWIGNLVLFGLGGVAIIKIVNPVLIPILDSVSLRTRAILAGILGVLFVADFIVSSFVLKLVKTEEEKSEADNTEEIRKEISLTLSDKSIFYRRFANAYPDVVYRTERIKERMDAVRAESERIREQAEQRLFAMNRKVAEGREQFSESLQQSKAQFAESLQQSREQLSEGIQQSREQLARGLESTGSIRNTVLQKQEELIRLLYNENTATEEMKQLKGSIDENIERLRRRHTLQ